MFIGFPHFQTTDGSNRCEYLMPVSSQADEYGELNEEDEIRVIVLTLDGGKGEMKENGTLAWE